MVIRDDTLNEEGSPSKHTISHTMKNRILAFIKPLFKTLFVFGLIATLVFSQADAAMAARAGGRIGGGSFRAPRTSIPRSTPYRGPSGYYPGGGGFFFLPFFGFGGGFGGLFTIILFISIANFLVRSFRNATGDDGYGGTTSTPTYSVAKLQIGLLADARHLQSDLNRIAASADTSSTSGLTQVLQEATLSLLRHPEYWIYGDASSSRLRFEQAEAEFNRLALTERSKFTAETMSNVNNQLQQASSAGELPSSGDLANLSEAPGEYIIATILVAAQGKVELPSISSEQDLRRALSQIGSVSSEDLQALEVLWTPQQEGETLTADEVVAQYPSLVRV